MTLMTAVRLQRTIPAPPDKVYRAWLEPELIRRGLQAAHVAPAIDGATDEARPFEDPDVLRRRGQRHSQRHGELADGQLPAGEPAEHLPAGTVREGVEDGVHRRVTFNHLVEGIPAATKSKPKG